MNTFEEPKVFECLELPIEGEESYRDLDGEVQAEKILLDTFDEMPSCFKRSWDRFSVVCVMIRQDSATMNASAGARDTHEPPFATLNSKWWLQQ